MTQSTDQAQTMLAAAALAACIVRTLDELSPGARQAARGHAEAVYVRLRDSGNPIAAAAMQALRELDELLK